MADTVNLFKSFNACIDEERIKQDARPTDGTDHTQIFTSITHTCASAI